MKMLRTRFKGLSAAVCLCGTLAMAQEALQEPATPARVRVATPRAVVVDGDNDGQIEVFFQNPNATPSGTVVVYADPNAAQTEPGKYWIGLICVEAGEALREQFSLDANVGLGLVVESIPDDAPAKKAGVQKNDVLLSATYPVDDAKGETKPLNQIGDLVASVQKAETKPLKLLLLRKGQKQIVEVTPAERPQTPIAVQVKRFGPAEQQLQVLLEAQRKQAAGQANQALGAVNTLRMAGPMFVPQQQAPKLPEGMTLEFRQVVGQPERILVSKGDQKWEITAEELQKLPADVRGPVEQQIAFRRASAMPAGFGVAGGGFGVGQPITFTPGQPAAIASPTTVHVESYSASGNLPDDLSVSIVKKGSEPARITVKKGEQSWEITEKELDKLPADVRKHVETMQSARPGRYSGLGTRWTARVPAPATTLEQHQRQLQDAIRPENQVRPQAWPPTQSNNQLQERQEAMLKQLQQLTEKVEKLQQALEKSTPKP